MTVTVFSFLTDHVVEADIYNYLLPLFILHSPCFSKYLNWLWFFAWWGGQLVVLSGLDYYSLTLTLITSHGNTKRCPVGSPIFQTYSSLPPLWRSSPVSPL